MDKNNQTSKDDPIELLRLIASKADDEVAKHSFRRFHAMYLKKIRFMSFHFFREYGIKEPGLVDEIASNVNLTQHIFNLVATEIKLTGFWDSTPAQLKLKAELQKMLLSPEFKDLPNIITKRNEIISRIMELAKTNHFKIVNE